MTSLKGFGNSKLQSRSARRPPQMGRSLLSDVMTGIFTVLKLTVENCFGNLTLAHLYLPPSQYLTGKFILEHLVGIFFVLTLKLEKKIGSLTLDQKFMAVAL